MNLLDQMADDVVSAMERHARDERMKITMPILMASIPGGLEITVTKPGTHRITGKQAENLARLALIGRAETQE